MIDFMPFHKVIKERATDPNAFYYADTWWDRKLNNSPFMWLHPSDLLNRNLYEGNQRLSKSNKELTRQNTVLKRENWDYKFLRKKSVQDK